MRTFNYRLLGDDSSSSSNTTSSFNLTDKVTFVGIKSYWIIAAHFVTGRAKEVDVDPDEEDASSHRRQQSHGEHLMHIYGLGAVAARELRDTHDITTYSELH